MGGDVWQWNETIINSVRGLRGGLFAVDSISMASSVLSLDGPDLESDVYRVPRGECS